MKKALTIAAGLARGMAPPEAAHRAKEYVTEAIRNGLSMGSDRGPTNHLTGVPGPPLARKLVPGSPTAEFDCLFATQCCADASDP
jgi:hypothetical protein